MVEKSLENIYFDAEFARQFEDKYLGYPNVRVQLYKDNFQYSQVSVVNANNESDTFCLRRKVDSFGRCKRRFTKIPKREVPPEFFELIELELEKLKRINEISMINQRINVIHSQTNSAKISTQDE